MRGNRSSIAGAGGGQETGSLARSNPKIKRLRRLLTRRRARSEERAFVVEGPLAVSEALDVVASTTPEGPGPHKPGLAIEAVFVEPGAAPEIVTRARSAGVPVELAAAGVLTAVLDTVTPRPVAAVVSRRPWTWDDLVADGPVVVVVDGRDPGNAGTLIRSAEASGAAGVVLTGASVDPTNPKVLRATAGAGLRHPVVVEPDTGRALEVLRAAGRPIVATAIDFGAVPYDQADLTEAAIVVGNESHGVPSWLLAEADVVVTIPLAGPTESLNLGVAASVLCFDALRQRRSGDTNDAADDASGVARPASDIRRSSGPD